MSETTAETPQSAKGRTPGLNKALSQLQGELPRITKTKTGKVEGENKAGKYFSYEYSYADLGDVVADVGPLLAKHGLAFHCGPTINPADRREMILVWSLLHESGEEKTGEWPLGPVNQKPQSLGSAITYGRRYCFTAATNIVLEDDDDGQRAQQAHTGRQSAGSAFDQAAPARPARQNGNGNGGRVSRPAQAPAAPPQATDAEPDPDAQPFFDEAHQARTLATLQDVHRRAREAGKLAALGRNPATGGVGGFGAYANWRKKQLEDEAAALEELMKAAGPMPIDGVEAHVVKVTGTSIEAASVAQLRQAAEALKAQVPA